MSTDMIQNTALAEEDDLAGRYLTFYIEDALYGVDLRHVIEIIGIQSIAMVPDVPYYIKGIINLRGRIVPVLDTRLRIGLPERAHDDHTCIVIIDIDDSMVGMIVDSVAEVSTFASEDLSSLPEFTNVNAKKYLSSISRSGDQLVLNLDCKQFLADGI